MSRNLPITIGNQKYYVPMYGDSTKEKCQCCGLVENGGQCYRCLKHTCRTCMCIEATSHCLICAVGIKMILSDVQQERLESIYSPGGFKFEEANIKIQQLTNL